MQFFTSDAFKSRFDRNKRNRSAFTRIRRCPCPAVPIFSDHITPGRLATTNRLCLNLALSWKLFKSCCSKAAIQRNPSSNFESRKSLYESCPISRRTCVRGAFVVGSCRCTSTKILITKLTMNLNDKLHQNTFSHCTFFVRSQFAFIFSCTKY